MREDRGRSLTGDRRASEAQADAPQAFPRDSRAIGVGDELLDDAVHEIRIILRRTGLERTLAIGSLVLERFFQGSVALWRERRNHKNNSVRRLALRPECPLARSSLNRAVAIRAVTLALPSVLSFGHIEAGHIGIVLPLDVEEQERWLTRANTARWSVRQLKDAIAGARPGSGERRGRPKAAEGLRALATSRNLLERFAASLAFVTRLELDSPSLVQVKAMGDRLATLLDELTRLSNPAPLDRAPWAGPQVRYCPADPPTVQGPAIPALLGRVLA
jgi:hypothetical protein